MVVRGINGLVYLLNKIIIYVSINGPFKMVVPATKGKSTSVNRREHGKMIACCIHAANMFPFLHPVIQLLKHYRTEPWSNAVVPVVAVKGDATIMC